MANPKINFDVILDTVGKNGAVVARVEKLANERFQPAKEQFLATILEHPVSQEIESGPGSENISGTLDGKGDLFSYIGFRKGSTPVKDFISFLRETLSLSRVTKVNKTSRKSLRFNFNVSIPSKGEITQVTSIPWNPGRSWVYAISEGLSGFGYYLSLKGIHDLRTKTGKRLARAIKKISRSGEAIEINIKGGRPGRFKNTSYFSTFLNNFRDILRK